MEVLDVARTELDRIPALGGGLDPIDEACGSGAGDPLTFEQVYEIERAALVALGLALTGSTAVAEDLVQEAFLRLHQKWDRVARYDSPGAWLRRVLLNLATSRARRLAAEARAVLRLGRERHAHSLAPEADSFWAAVRALPAGQARTLTLYYLEDRSVAEVARILACAEGTVRAQLHQGRKTLRARLGTSQEITDER